MGRLNDDAPQASKKGFSISMVGDRTVNRKKNILSRSVKTIQSTEWVLVFHDTKSTVVCKRAPSLGDLEH